MFIMKSCHLYFTPNKKEYNYF